MTTSTQELTAEVDVHINIKTPVFLRSQQSTNDVIHLLSRHGEVRFLRDAPADTLTGTRRAQGEEGLEIVQYSLGETTIIIWLPYPVAW